MNADTSGGGHAVAGAVLGGTAGDGWGRAAAYDAYADGLHTYALWYLHDHDAAADAVYCAFVAADRNHTNLQQPEQIQPWLYALLRRECRLRVGEPDSPSPVSRRVRPKPDALDESGVSASLVQLEGNLRRAEFQSLAWAEAEGLSPAHREVLELTIRHGLDSRGLALVLGLREGAAGLASTRGFGLLADAWRELERSLAAAAVAASGRENCAQLAELTFGWSGKFNATLRAPLTEHVDGCSRCQHYLHTVIGTPSAPTILPFVAAPRALRDMLLGELADFDAASDAGVDLVALGSRCGVFGPEGFPARVDLSQQQGTSNPPAGAGRGPRRRQPGSGRVSRPQRAAPSAAIRPQPVHNMPGSGPAGDGGGSSGSGGSSGYSGPSSQATPLRSVQSTSSASETPGPGTHRQPPMSQPANPTPATNQPNRPNHPNATNTPNATDVGAARPESGDELFRARGSWADKVLPPEAAAAAALRRNSRDAAAVAAAASASANSELWRPDPHPGFVQTPSGRFAMRPPVAPVSASAAASAAPAPPRRPAGLGPAPTVAATTAAFPATSTYDTSVDASGPMPVTSAASAASVSPRIPRFARPATSTPKSPGSGSTTALVTATTRPRHKARPMKQAVFSAMAPGAIGAVAAAAAAMLGVGSNPHANMAALDGSQSSEALGSASTADPSGGAGASRLSVSVTTGAAGSTTPGLLTGDTGAGAGLLSSAGGASAGAAPTTASAGAFYVSVNQRAADPDSVQILLRNTGGSSLDWSAAPSVSWLTLSQGSGTLAPDQSIEVTATATGAAPSGQWAARIVFSPGGIVVTLHGGIPGSTDQPTAAPSSGSGSGSGGTGTGGTGGTGTTSSSPSTSASPSTSPTSQSPTPTASATSSKPAAPPSDPASGAAPTTASGPHSSTPTDTATAPPSSRPSRPVRRH